MNPPQFERKQRVRLRMRSYDREAAAEVSAATEDTVWVKLSEPHLWLDDRHLEGGIDLSFWRNGHRHVAQEVGVITYDLDRGRIQLKRPRSFEIIQRRKTFRETVEVPVRWVRADLPEETLDLQPGEAVTEDLGGGGLCISGDAMSVGVNEELQLEIELPDRTVRARGRVRWAGEGPDGKTRMGLAFTRIGEREQDLVYGFLFDLQRSRLRPA